jgi:hypothetical protein
MSAGDDPKRVICCSQEGCESGTVRMLDPDHWYCDEHFPAHPRARPTDAWKVEADDVPCSAPGCEMVAPRALNDPGFAARDGWVIDEGASFCPAHAALAGRKFDGEKARWDLVPWKAFGRVVEVLTLGARKYAAWNWVNVPNAHERYFASAHRHLFAWRSGERDDPETGLPHLAHLICCALFLIGFDEKDTGPVPFAEKISKEEWARITRSDGARRVELDE